MAARQRYSSPVNLLQKVTATRKKTDAVRKLVAELRARAAAGGFSKGVSGRPYDPRVFAAVLGAKTTRAADLEFDGRVASFDADLIIEYDRQTRTTHRWRFTVAHEVAHLALWDAEQKLLPGAKRRKPRGSSVERLCDEIAVEILSPYEEITTVWNAVRSERTADGRGWARAIQQIAVEFRISLEMAAIRFAEVCAPGSGAGLFDAESRSLVWSHGVPERTVLLELLCSRIHLEDPTETEVMNAASYSYYGPGGDLRYVPTEWERVPSNHFLVVVKPYTTRPPLSAPFSSSNS